MDIGNFCSPIDEPGENLSHQGEVGLSEVLHGDEPGVAQTAHHLGEI